MPTDARGADVDIDIFPEKTKTKWRILLASVSCYNVTKNVVDYPLLIAINVNSSHIK